MHNNMDGKSLIKNLQICYYKATVVKCGLIKINIHNMKVSFVTFQFIINAQLLPNFESD